MNGADVHRGPRPLILLKGFRRERFREVRVREAENGSGEGGGLFSEGGEGVLEVSEAGGVEREKPTSLLPK